MNTFRFYRAPGLDRNEKRFTLIELLIVISIIAILMSILLPSLNLVREKARGISCLSNLKQNGIATTNYMDSYDGYILQWASWENIYAWTDFVYAFPDEQSKGLGHLYCPSLPPKSNWNGTFGDLRWNTYAIFNPREWHANAPALSGALFYKGSYIAYRPQEIQTHRDEIARDLAKRSAEDPGALFFQRAGGGCTGARKDPRNLGCVQRRKNQSVGSAESAPDMAPWEWSG